MNLLAIFKRKPTSTPTSKREVLLFTMNGDQKVVVAQKSQAGWIAQFYNADCWCVLGAGGKILRGPGWVTGWLPHSGWDGTEGLPEKL